MEPPGRTEKQKTGVQLHVRVTFVIKAKQIMKLETLEFESPSNLNRSWGAHATVPSAKTWGTYVIVKGETRPLVVHTGCREKVMLVERVEKLET
jgi:hypothetical protein